MQNVSSQDSLVPVCLRVGGRIARTYYYGHARSVIHVFARVCRTLGIVQEFLMQLPVLVVITYCKEVMRKNEHTFLVAYFSPSVFVRQCVSLSSFLVSKRREAIRVFPLAGWQLCHSCGISQMVPPIFSQMSPFSLLTGANITFVGAPFIRQQYRHDV